MALETEKEKGPPYTRFFNHMLELFFDKEYFDECEIHVFLVILRYTIGFDRIFWTFSYDFLCEKTSYSKPWVIDSIKDLQKRNIIENVKKPGNKINVYQINIKTSTWIKRNSKVDFTQLNKQAKQNSKVDFTQVNKGPKGKVDLTDKGKVDLTDKGKVDLTDKGKVDLTQVKKDIYKNILKKNIYINKEQKIISSEKLKELLFADYHIANDDNIYSFIIRELYKENYMVFDKIE